MILERLFDIIMELEHQKNDQPPEEADEETHKAWCV